jgi:aminopeptidase N
MRTRYNHDALAALATHFAELTPDDQIGVLKDTASLANAGQQPMADYLELTKHFPATAHPVVVSALVGQFLGIDDLYRGLASQAAYRAYARSVLKPVFARVGWDAQPGGSDNDIILRADLIEALAEFDDADALAWTRERFERYLANPKLFDANARSSLLHNVALHADQKLWDRLHRMAKTATSELERQDLYDLLGLAESDALAKQALGLVFSDELASSPTTGPRIISAVSQRHPEMALDFSLANWDKVYQKLEVGSALQYLPGLARNSTDLKSIDKLNAFAVAKVPENARQDYVLAAARIRYQAKVRAERLPEVDKWLAAQN